MTVVFLIAGLVLLVIGAESLVKGASRVAAGLGVPALIVGLTVVAFGTSTPELAVSSMAAISGQGEIALGNVVGSNICNVLLILGISALIVPLRVARQLIWLDVPVMVLISALVFLLVLDGQLSRAEGALLAGGLVVYTLVLIGVARRQRPVGPKDEFDVEYGKPAEFTGRSWLISLVLIAVGLGLLILGSRWLVNGAVAIAEAFGISQLVIGLTVVAVGTSMPEIATSIIAGFRGERDIAVGNVVGSNIFNLLGVLGLSSMLSPDGIPIPRAALTFDMPVMLAAAAACLPIFFTGHSIARWEGGVFLAYYAAYTLYVVLSASAHDALTLFSAAMLWFVIPLTVLTLFVLTVRAVRGRPKGG